MGPDGGAGIGQPGFECVRQGIEPAQPGASKPHLAPAVDPDGHGGATLCCEVGSRPGRETKRSRIEVAEPSQVGDEGGMGHDP